MTVSIKLILMISIRQSLKMSGVDWEDEENLLEIICTFTLFYLASFRIGTWQLYFRHLYSFIYSLPTL